MQTTNSGGHVQTDTGVFTARIRATLRSSVLQRVVLFCGLLLLCIVLKTPQANAAPCPIGASWQFPDQNCSTNAGSLTPRSSWTTTEMCNRASPSACMRGAINAVMLYVPTSLAGSTQRIDIIDGCDNSVTDNQGGRNSRGASARTDFWAADGNMLLSAGHPGTGPVSSDDAGCPDFGNWRADQSLNFYVDPAGPTYGGYFTFYLYAVGNSLRGDGTSWYSNLYRFQVNNPATGIKLGVFGSAGGSLNCDRATWPHSCPTTGLAYTSVAASDNSRRQWNFESSMAISCSGAPNISNDFILYDPDHSIYQNNMTLFVDLLDRASKVKTGPFTPAGTGVLVNGGNEVDWRYRISYNSSQIAQASIWNIGEPNSLQLNLVGDSNSPNVACGPIGPPPPPPTFAFTLTSQPQIPVITSGDEELPLALDFSGTVGFTGAASRVNGVNIDRNVFINRGGSYNGGAGTLSGGSNIAIGAAVPSGNINVTSKPAQGIGTISRGGLPALQAGDLVCIRLSVSPSTGRVDGSGAIQPGASGTSTSVQCRPIVNRPYARFYGNDIAAGSGFMTPPTTTCSGGNGKVNTYVKPSGAGSSSQLGIFADSTVGSGYAGAGKSNLASMMLQDALSGQFNNRIFANVGSLGNFGTTLCAYSFPNPTSYSGPPVSSIGSSLSGAYRLLPQPSGLSVGNFTGKAALYANGDVRISGNIAYSPNPVTIDNLPSLVLVVHGGNIYIDPDVTQIDGTFVAVPAGGSGGKIFTCSNNSWPASPPSSGQLTPPGGNCSQRSLTVNGALIAQRVNFLRTHGSLRGGSPSETFTSNNPAANAAEIIRFSPEVYMADSAVPAYDTIDTFQSILGLPPSL